MHQRHARRLGDRLERPRRASRLLEVLVVVGIMGALAGDGDDGVAAFSQARAGRGRHRAGARRVCDSAREVAISQRRNVRGASSSASTRSRRVAIDIGANGVRRDDGLRTVELENRMQFRLGSGVPDTPDAVRQRERDRRSALRCGALACSRARARSSTSRATSSTARCSWRFPNQANSARAITIFGTTALIRPWRWNGREWVE